MARLSGVVLSEDETFQAQIGALLRTGPVAVSVVPGAGRDTRRSDLIVMDARQDAAATMTRVESLKATTPAATIFVVAADPNPDLILQAMRAGANEFFTFPPPADTFHEALRRAAARRSASGSGPSSTTVVFFGAKGGAGTTTVAVNSAVEIARLSKKRAVIVDLKPGLGEISLFLGIRSRYTLLDALDNIHRLDSEFLRELVVKHKSGLDILAGSDHFDRPGPSDGAGLEEVFRLLRDEYDYVVIDAGSQIHSGSIAALYTADIIGLVANPDVPSIRNAQRLLERIRQLGASADRVRLLLNRAAEPYPIPVAQIEGAVGHPIDHTFPSDYKTVSTALNSGVPLALSGSTPLAAQFDSFTRRVLDAEGETAAVEATAKKGTTGLSRLASMW